MRILRNLSSRNYQSDKKADGKREKYTKKYAFSSMCESGFCGTKFTRCILYSSSKYETPVWYCRNTANKGKHNCPSSKSVHESIREEVIVGETNDDGTVDPFKLTFL